MAQALPQEISSTQLLRWTDKQFHATQESGTVVFTSYPIPAQFMDPFLEPMHSIVENNATLKWCQDFFLWLQIQGTKTLTKHTLLPLTDSEDQERAELMGDYREEAFSKAIRPLDPEKMNLNSYWVDLATTVHQRDCGFSVLPRSNMHAWMICAATGIPVTEAAHIVKVGAREGYYKDNTAHLGSVSGLRLTRKNGTPSGAYYLQVYTTDKNLTALKDKNTFAKHMEPRQMFKNFPKVSQNFYSQVLGAFQTARWEELAADVMIEIWVPLSQLTEALDFDAYSKWAAEDNQVARAGRNRKRLRITAAVGKDMNPILADEAEDIPEAAIGEPYSLKEEDPELAPDRLEIRKVVKAIFQKMAGEVMMRIPESRDKSYQIISKHQALKIQYKAICDSREIPNILIRWRQSVDTEKWHQAVMTIFPLLKDYGELTTTRNGKKKEIYAQGLQQLLFHQDWVALIKDKKMSQQDKEKLVKVAKAKVNKEVAWLPGVGCDKLWNDPVYGKLVVHGEAHPGKGVMVFLNPAFEPNNDLPGGFFT
ncbi:hypothetical protein FRC07_004139 [Ceratobasidium sp. 392]|nr:hypothetical protein FRC07_004139 [Ceratobasidium sp. 392]